jgi:hypothetical protein
MVVQCLMHNFFDDYGKKKEDDIYKRIYKITSNYNKKIASRKKKGVNIKSEALHLQLYIMHSTLQTCVNCSKPNQCQIGLFPVLMW